MMKTCLAVLLIAISFHARSQKPDTLKLFYEINKSAASYQGISKLDSFMALHPNKGSAIKVYGYADFLWKPDYNLTLSEQRAALIKNYLYEKGYDSVSAEGKGQVAATIGADLLKGEPFDRRVEVIVQAFKSAAQDVAAKKTVAEPPKTVYTEKPLSQASAGEHIILSGLTFLPGRHVVRPEAMTVAKQLFDEMKKSPNLKIELQGFICCVPPGYDGLDTDTQEIKLSLNRAKAIYEYLVQRGIDSSRITYKGFGSSNHKVWPERNENDRIQNRRVEVVVVENK